MTPARQLSPVCAAALVGFGVCAAEASEPAMSLRTGPGQAELKVRLDLPKGPAELKVSISFTRLSEMSEVDQARLAEQLIGWSAYGVKIQSAAALPGINRLIGSGAAQLDVLEVLPDNSVVVLARDENGAPALDSEVFLIEPTGNVLCTLREKLAFAESARGRQYYEVLLDVSGSMEYALDETKRAALSFIDRMGTNAQCRVSYYNDKYKVQGVLYGTSGGWRPCAAANFDLSSLEAGGGTESTGALLSALRELAKPTLDSSVKALFVATDGDGIDDGELEQIRGQKGAVPVFVYFAGEYSAQRYEQWVERFIFGDAAADVEGAFVEFSDRFVNAQVVNPNSCAVIAASAKP